MNKRAHIRHLVVMPARLILGGEPDRVCQVQNFCLGGMLLVLPEPGLPPSRRLEPDTSVRLALDVQGVRGMRRVILPARVRRRNGMSVGVAFDCPDRQDLLALQHHVRTLLQKERCGARDPAYRSEAAERPQPHIPGAEPAPVSVTTTYRTAWRLIRRTYTTTNASCELPEASRHAVARALKSLQRHGLTDRDLPKVMEELARQEGLDESAALRAQAELVEVLIRRLADHGLLDESLREASMALQVPVLCTVLIHEHALAGPHSALAHLLDCIVTLGAQGQAGEALTAADAFFTANHFTISALKRIADKAHEAVRRADDRFHHRAGALATRCQRREQRSNAERSLNRQLEARLCGRPIPAVILALLNAGWREVLLETLWREGERGAGVEHALDVIERLVQALDRIPPREELSMLLARIKHGLARVDGRQIPGTRLGPALRDLLIKERREQSDPAVLVLPVGTFEKPARAACMRASDELSLRDFVETLARGEWYVLQRKDRRRALRFVWASENQELFTFTGPTGEGSIEFDRPALTQAVLDGNLRHVAALTASPVMAVLEAMLEQCYQALTTAARHDPATGLLTQSELYRQLSRESGARGTLVWIAPSGEGPAALPGRKETEAGLLHAAEILKEMFHNRLTARADGQGLLLWLSGTGLVAARTAVEAMRRRLQAGRQGLPITLSFGLAEHRPLQPLDSLMQEAEGACRVAIARGGGVHLVEEPEKKSAGSEFDFSSEAEVRLVLQSRHAAPASGSLRPACVVEARLVGPDGESLAPGASAGSSVHHSQMPALDRRMITSLLRWLHKNGRLAARHDHFLLRLSCLSLRDGGLPDFLREQLQRYSIDPVQVCLAFAETDVAEDVEVAGRRMRTLKETGCRLALVGSGLGEISVRQLKALPMDILAPDEALVDAALGGEPRAQALIQGLVEVARFAGTRTLAPCPPGAMGGNWLKEVGMDWVEQPASSRRTASGKLSLNPEPT